MKPKEFIEKYSLEKGWNPKHQNSFLQDLTSELLAFLELNKAENNIRGFDNAVKVIRMKWDAISNKIPRGLPDKLWSYFWAITVVKIREELCPAAVERMRKEAEERKAEYERRKEYRRREQEWFNATAHNDMFEKLSMLYMFLISVPYGSFMYLELPESATEKQIKARYREMALKLHPDKGGDQEEFIRLTEHKNKCLKWASMNNR